jgi:hypothetical protein
MDSLNEILYKIFLRSPNNLFNEFLKECQTFYDKPAHNLIELKQRKNTKIKGDIFEEFSVLYLKHVKKYNNVWLLKELPDDVLMMLNMKRRDMGIDLIVEHNGDFYAVQCKYKKACTFKKNVLSWKQLSTFYALCMRTGPFNKYIIMTNCDYTRHQGDKTEKDLSICLKSFQNITKDQWLLMCDKVGAKISDDNPVETITYDIQMEKKDNKEKLRELRLKYFDKH